MFASYVASVILDLRGNHANSPQSKANPAIRTPETSPLGHSGRYPSHIRATAVFGIPGTSQRAPSADTEMDGTQAPVDGGFTAARSGQYRLARPGARTCRKIAPPPQ